MAHLANPLIPGIGNMAISAVCFVALLAVLGAVPAGRFVWVASGNPSEKVMRVIART